MADKEYREGDEQANGESEEKPIPATAFVVILHQDGRIEAGTNLENMPMLRQANLRDIRDMSSALSKDVETTMTAQACAGMVSQGIAQSMRQMQEQQMKAKIMGNMKPGGMPQ